MGYKAMRAVQLQSRFRHHSSTINFIPFKLLLALAWYADDETGKVGVEGKPEVCPSIRTLAAEAGVHRNSVLNWLPQMSDEVTYTQHGSGRGAHCVYQLHLNIEQVPLPVAPASRRQADQLPANQLPVDLAEELRQIKLTLGTLTEQMAQVLRGNTAGAQGNVPLNGFTAQALRGNVTDRQSNVPLNGLAAQAPRGAGANALHANVSLTEQTAQALRGNTAGAPDNVPLNAQMAQASREAEVNTPQAHVTLAELLAQALWGNMASAQGNVPLNQVTAQASRESQDNALLVHVLLAGLMAQSSRGEGDIYFPAENGRVPFNEETAQASRESLDNTDVPLNGLTVQEQPETAQGNGTMAQGNGTNGTSLQREDVTDHIDHIRVRERDKSLSLSQRKRESDDRNPYLEQIWPRVLDFTAGDLEQAKMVLKAQAIFAEAGKMKQPYANGDQRQAMTLRREWWEPLAEMVTEADCDLELFGRVLAETFSKADRDRFIIATPSAARKTFQGLLAKQRRQSVSASRWDEMTPEAVEAMNRQLNAHLNTHP